MERSFKHEGDGKMQKLSEDQDIVGGENYLCKLDETIHRHILSLLPIKDAVRTSVLSNHWEHKWTSIPNLVFASYDGNPTTFFNFVDRALTLRNHDINKFTIATDVLLSLEHINRWIAAAVCRDVQFLSIALHKCNNTFELPCCLFSCVSLRSISLSLPPPVTLKLPSSIWLSHLKTLSLSNITFPDDHSTQTLFLGCPVLGYLTLDRCDWKNINNANICSPKLSQLRINEATWNESHCCQISISGSCLRFFSYCGDFNNDYSIYDSSLLDQVSVRVRQCGIQQSSIVSNRLVKLLNGQRDTKKLSLSSSCIKILDSAPQVLAYIPLFKMLSTLEICSPLPVNLHHKALTKMLQMSPSLKSLKFSAVIEVPPDSEQIEGIFQPAPSCFLSALKKIYIKGIKGSKQQTIDVVEMFLNRAEVLQSFKFHLGSTINWYGGEIDVFVDEIRALPRSSEEVVFNVLA